MGMKQLPEAEYCVWEALSKKKIVFWSTKQMPLRVPELWCLRWRNRSSSESFRRVVGALSSFSIAILWEGSAIADRKMSSVRFMKFRACKRTASLEWSIYSIARSLLSFAKFEFGFLFLLEFRSEHVSYSARTEKSAAFSLLLFALFGIWMKVGEKKSIT